MLTDQVALWAPHSAGDTRPPFRPIHYLGSKVRLLGPIGEAINFVDPSNGPVLDLFAGSGVVAAHLAERRAVLAVDIQEYSRVIAAALLAPAQLSKDEGRALVEHARALYAGLVASPVAELVGHERACVTALAAGDAEPMCELLEHGSVFAAEHGEGPPNGPLAHALAAASAVLADSDPPLVLTRLYGGVYFAYQHALMLDCLLAAVRALPAGYLDTGLAAVMSTASDCVTSVGNHFAQPMRPRNRHGEPKLHALLRAARKRESDVFERFETRLRSYASLPVPPHRALAIQADYRDFLASNTTEITAVYADPPYTRDHYSRFYHVLETIALGDEPAMSQMRINGHSRLSRGLYRTERHQSPFCIRSKAPGAFAELFAGVRRHGAALVLSYSPYTHGTAARPRPRLLTISELVDLASEFFSDVAVVSAGVLSHSKFNATHLNGSAPDEAEVLILCRG